MWGRILQIAAACWIAASPFALTQGADSPLLRGTNLASAIIIALLALGSFHRRLPHLHVATAAPAIWMIGVTFLTVQTPPPPVYQSNAIMGLMLLILMLVPSRSAEPPHAWQEFNARYRAENE